MNAKTPTVSGRCHFNSYFQNPSESSVDSREILTRKKSRNCSKSFSSAYEYPHDTASRTECLALSRSTLVCMRILISNLIRYLRIIRILLLKMRLIMPPRFIVFVSSEDMGFQILIEEVLKLLRAY